MRSKRDFMLVGCAALLWFGAGCSDTDEPTEDDYDNVAQALGSVAATDDGGGEVGSMIDVSAIVTGTDRIGIEVKASGSFSGTRAGLTYDYDVTCADSAGKALNPCSSETDSAKVNVKWSGELATPVISGAVSRAGMIEISDIQSGTVTINGAGNLTVDAHFDALLRDASADYHLSYEANYDDLRVQRAPAKVLSGSITYALDVQREAKNRARESSAHFEIDAELVFQDGSAKLTLDGDHSYMVSATGAVAKVGSDTP